MSLFGRRLRMVHQTQRGDCGLACLAMVACYHGQKVELQHLHRLAGPSGRGMNVKELLDVTPQIGLSARLLRCEVGQLANLRLPAVLHWRFDHVVVLSGVKGGVAEIHDPATGVKRMKLSDLARHFTGLVLEFDRTSKATFPKLGRRIKLADMMRAAPAFGRKFSLIASASILLQIIELLSPLFFQLLVDAGVLTGDAVVIGLISGVAMAVAFAGVAAHYVRGRVIGRLVQDADLNLSSALMRHLLSLPLAYFLNRNAGDLRRRVWALRSVRKLASVKLFEALTETASIVVTSAILLSYSLVIWLTVVALVLPYGLARALRVSRSRQAVAAQATQAGVENSSLAEAIEGVETIKLYAAEQTRHAIWRNEYDDLMDAEIRLDSLRLTDDMLSEGMINVGRVAIATLAAFMVVRGQITVGMLIAIGFYQAMLFSKLKTAADGFIDAQKIDEHLLEIDDIVSAQPEACLYGAPGVQLELTGKMEVEGLSFRYADGEPEIVRDFGFTACPGEVVAITGPSGCGKSTTIKLLAALLKPSGGRVLYDGMTPEVIGLQNLRRQIGTVLQDDHLFHGTLFQNISMFDINADEAWLVECCKAACAHDFIIKLKMGYNSLVSQREGGLSGGQRQRVLLARALYKRPRILFLDESSSHLDRETEFRVNQALRRLTITRIIVAHRVETIALADKTVRIGQPHAELAAE